jgi:hypothetical protein
MFISLLMHMILHDITINLHDPDVILSDDKMSTQAQLVRCSLYYIDAAHSVLYHGRVADLLDFVIG